MFLDSQMRVDLVSDGVDRRSLDREPQGLRNRLEHEGRVLEWRQANKRGTIGEVSDGLIGSGEGEAGLADAAGTGEGEQGDSGIGQ